jgi:hypothetical protein
MRWISVRFGGNFGGKSRVEEDYWPACSCCKWLSSSVPSRGEACGRPLNGLYSRSLSSICRTNAEALLSRGTVMVDIVDRGFPVKRQKFLVEYL